MVLNLHIGDAFSAIVNYMLNNWEPFFDGISAIINFIAGGIDAIL